MNKTLRQRAVLDVLKHGTIASQDDLQRHLRRRGFKVGQATLSRDIHELGLIKTAEGYGISNGDQRPEPAGVPAAMRLVREFVTEVREAQNLIVVKTAAGSAQPVASALDAENWPELVGTVGGDDTILVISQSKKNARKLALRLQGML